MHTIVSKDGEYPNRQRRPPPPYPSFAVFIQQTDFSPQGIRIGSRLCPRYPRMDYEAPSRLRVNTAHRLTVSVFRSGIREEIDTGLWDVCRQKGG